MKMFNKSNANPERPIIIIIKKNFVWPLDVKQGGEKNKNNVGNFFFVFVSTFLWEELDREREHNLRQIEIKTQLNLRGTPKYQNN